MRVLLVSDIHSNYVALETVLNDAHGAFDVVWNLGDTIGYGPRPNECMARMLDLDAVMIAGNHDLACIGSNKVNIHEFNIDAKRANIWNGKQLDPAYAKYLAELPIYRDMGEDYYIVHGSPRDPVWEYLWQPWQADANWAYLASQQYNQHVCFIGHSHLQIYLITNADGQTLGPLRPQPNLTITFNRGERYYVNPGSVGQPRDGDPTAAYAILDTDAHTLTFKRVAYDIAQTQRQMQAHEPDLSPTLSRRLAVGK
jgi:predicted phosphodiesterase